MAVPRNFKNGPLSPRQGATDIFCKKKFTNRSYRGRRTLGCPRLGRPARASSNAMETKEEQHVEVGKD